MSRIKLTVEDRLKEYFHNRNHLYDSDGNLKRDKLFAKIRTCYRKIGSIYRRIVICWNYKDLGQLRKELASLDRWEISRVEKYKLIFEIGDEVSLKIIDLKLAYKKRLREMKDYASFIQMDPFFIDKIREIEESDKEHKDPLLIDYSTIISFHKLKYSMDVTTLDGRKVVVKF